MENYCQANLLDLVSIEQLEMTCFPTEAFNRGLIKNLLINPRSVVIKATAPSGRIIGNIVGVKKKEGSLPIGRIFSLCVLAEHRKKGVATRLIHFLEEKFSSHGVTKITLEVNTNNNVAQLFYKRHGYRMTPVLFA